MNINVRISIAIAVAIFVWLFSGLFISSANEAEGTQVQAPLTHIEAVWSETQEYKPKLMLRAKTEANREVNIKAQVSGRIVAVPGAEGVLVKSGETLCEIDAEDRARQIDFATSALNQATIEYQGAQRLKQGGYQSELAIAQAKTRLESARAAYERSQIDFANLAIKAPFDGIIERRPVEIGDFVQPGQLCAQIVELDPLKVSALISESEIVKVSLGSEATLTLVNGEVLTGVVSYLSHQADQVTRSYRIEATVPNPQMNFRAGMSGRLELEEQPVEAHLVAASMVLLDDVGNPAVRAVSEDGLISTLPVKIVGEQTNGVWVVGLPQRAALITVGQNYVASGEKVVVSFASSLAL